MLSEKNDFVRSIYVKLMNKRCFASIVSLIFKNMVYFYLARNIEHNLFFPFLKENRAHFLPEKCFPVFFCP